MELHSVLADRVSGGEMERQSLRFSMAYIDHHIHTSEIFIDLVSLCNRPALQGIEGSSRSRQVFELPVTATPPALLDLLKSEMHTGNHVECFHFVTITLSLGKRCA